jgi:hypothetical protein
VPVLGHVAHGQPQWADQVRSAYLSRWIRQQGRDCHTRRAAVNLLDTEKSMLQQKIHNLREPDA